MRRCTCDRHIPGEPFVLGRDCRLCWLYHNDPRYRKHWDGDDSAPPRRGQCDHIGGQLRLQLCESCCGTVNIKVFACAIHGACSLGKPADQLKSCRTCEDFVSNDSIPTAVKGST